MLRNAGVNRAELVGDGNGVSCASARLGAFHTRTNCIWKHRRLTFRDNAVELLGTAIDEFSMNMKRTSAAAPDG